MKIQYILLISIIAGVSGIGIAQIQPPEIQWIQTYSDTVTDSRDLYDIEQVGDKYILCGSACRLIDRHRVRTWICEVDTLGELTNENIFNILKDGHLIVPNRLICVTPDSGYATTGGGSASSLMRFNREGDSLWTREYRSDDWVMNPKDICWTGNGFAILSKAIPDGLATIAVPHVVITDENGELVWQRVFDEYDHNAPKQIFPIENDGFLILNEVFFNSNIDEYAEVHLIRVDNDLNIVWDRLYDGVHIESNPMKMVRLDDYNFVILEMPRNEQGICCARLFWTDLEGEDGGVSEPYPTPFQTYDVYSTGTPDGGFAMVGGNDGTGDLFYFLRLDCYGEMLYETEYDTIRNHQSGIRLISTADSGFAIGLNGHLNGDEELQSIVMKLAPEKRLSIVSEPFPPHPTLLSLSAYPNPFNSRTTLTFDLQTGGVVRLAVVDPLGRRLHELIPAQAFSSGAHSLPLDAADLPSGVYLIRLESSSGAVVRPLTLMR